jgi:hypothetical protein
MKHIVVYFLMDITCPAIPISPCSDASVLYVLLLEAPSWAKSSEKQYDLLMPP